MLVPLSSCCMWKPYSCLETFEFSLAIFHGQRAEEENMVARKRSIVEVAEYSTGVINKPHPLLLLLDLTGLGERQPVTGRYMTAMGRLAGASLPLEVHLPPASRISPCVISRVKYNPTDSHSPLHSIFSSAHIPVLSLTPTLTTLRYSCRILLRFTCRLPCVLAV